MTTISLLMHAPVGDVFAPGCFDSQIGEHVQVKPHMGGSPSYTGTLLAAKVADDGGHVELTLELP